MSRRIVCDGCERWLGSHDVALHGQRGAGGPESGPSPLPIRDFHLCADCAVIGFLAIQAHAHELTRDV